MKSSFFALVAALFVFGCGKTEDSADNSASPNTKGTLAKTTEMPVGGADTDKYMATGAYKPVNDIFAKNCVKCHGANGKSKGGIDLTTYDGVMKGGEEGAIVVAGKPDDSKLVMALHGKNAKQMPPRQPLSDADIKTIETWIKGGAKKS